MSRKRSASVLVAAGIMFSRLSGLVRETIRAMFLANGAANDALVAATRIPNVLQMLLGEGTLSASFIPVYSAALEEDEEEAGRIAGAIAAILAVVTGVLVLIGVLGARPIASVIAAGLRDKPNFELVVTLVRITFPAAGILVMSAWCLGVLNSHRKFFLSYVAPVLWNIAQIAAIVIGAVVFGMADTDADLNNPAINTEELGDLARVAAIGFFVGAIAQFVVQLPSVFTVARGLKFRLDTTRAGVRSVISRFGGAVLGRGVVQISAMVDVFLAGLLVEGALSSLNSSQILYILPISVFAVSVAASELPDISKMTIRDEVRIRSEGGYQRILFFVSFTALAYVLLGDKIVGTLFERGNFGTDDTLLVWMVLGAYALGLPAAAVSRLTQNAVWSRGDTKGPARIAAVRLAIAALFAIATMRYFDGFSPENVRQLPTIPEDQSSNPALRFGAVGLTLGSAIASWAEAILLGRLADRHIPNIAPLRPLVRLLPALFAAGGVAIVTRGLVVDMPNIVAMLLSVGPSGLTYLAVCRLTGIADVNLFLKGPLRRLRMR